VKPYFLSLIFLSFLAACSNASGTKDKKADTAQSAAAGQTAAGHPTAQTPPAHPDTLELPARHQNSPEEDLRVATQSTLAGRQENVCIPPFGLSQVLAAIRRMHEVDTPEGDAQYSIALSDSDWLALSLDEKFTYNMIHAETWSQMCDALPTHKHEGQRIYSHIPNYFGEYDWSDRQLKFFKENLDTTEQLMKTVIGQQNKIGMNFLDIIVYTNAVDMIPYLIEAWHKDSVNHYILSTLLLLMEKNKFPEFMTSASYKKLYGDEGQSYSAYLIYNKANEDLILQRAIDFYHSQDKTTRP
jgi:hypothetical protein